MSDENFTESNLPKPVRIKEWLSFAEMNYETINLLMQQYKKMNRIICFNCQESLEKYLKACMIQYNFPIPKTHDLVEIVEYLENKDFSFNEIKPYCNLISTYGTPARYPSFDLDITDDLTEYLVKSLNKCRGFILDVLKDYIQEENLSKEETVTDIQNEPKDSEEEDEDEL